MKCVVVEKICEMHSHHVLVHHAPAYSPNEAEMASIVQTNNDAITNEDDVLQRDEIEALAAIFVENFELVRDTPPRRFKIAIAGEVLLTVSMPARYPSIEQPKTTLSVHPSSSCRRSTKDFIQKYKFPSFEKGGLGCIFDQVQDISDSLPFKPNQERAKSTPEHGDEGERLLLFIDHMNDSRSYQKILKRWSAKLDLHLEIWYRIVSKSKNCKRNSSANAEATLPTGKLMRAESVYVFLQGEKPDINAFLQKLKVEYVDVNKQGIKCKERKSKILMRMLMQTLRDNASCRFSFTDYAQLNSYSSETRDSLRQRLESFGYVFPDAQFKVIDSIRRILLIKFDHIKSKQVRKAIKGIASSLNLTGLLRPGKPGLVCVEGAKKNIAEFEKIVRTEFSTCTRNSGCWGPANHHFQSISVIGEKNQCHREYFEAHFVEVETESLMHVAHKFVNAGLKQLFFTSFPTLNPDWDIPSTTGNPDPYLKQRGGTRRKCSNKRML